MNRESFVFYRSFYESINALDKTTQLELYNAICEYSLNGNEPNLKSPISGAIFTLMKVNLDRANARYTASVENGKKGGRPRKEKNLEKPNNNLNITYTKPNQNLNDNYNDNYNVNDNDNTTNSSNFLELVQNEFLNITPMQYEMLIELENKYGTNLCIEALKECSKNNKKTINYLKGVLKNWSTNTKKEIKPNWLEAKIEYEPMEEQEQEELNEMFKEFKN